MNTYNKEKFKHTTKKYYYAGLFLIPFTVLFIMFFLIPFIKGITMSFYHYNIADPTDTYFVGFDNYINFLFQKEVPLEIGGIPVVDSEGKPMMVQNTSYYAFWYSLLYTILFCLVIVPTSIILPLFLAIGIKRKPYGYKLFRSLIYLPSIFAVSSTGAAFVYLFANNEVGFINNLFGTNISWLNNQISAWFVIFLLCLYGIGGNFIIITAGLENVNKNLYESAEIDGSNFWQKLRYVTLPGIKYQIIICTFTTIIGYMNLYGQNRVLTMGGPADFDHPERPGVTHSIIYVIQDYLTGSGKFSMAGKISAIAICLGIIIAFITAIQLFISRDKKGGDKYAKEFIEYEKNSN